MTLFGELPTDFDDWFRRGGLESGPEALWADGAAYPSRAKYALKQ
jgi:uncharacterized NAD(P)/FAD-binding protein YdhS